MRQSNLQVNSFQPEEQPFMGHYSAAVETTLESSKPVLFIVSDNSVKDYQETSQRCWDYHNDLEKRRERKDQLAVEFRRLAEETNDQRYWDFHNAFTYCSYKWTIVNGVPKYEWRRCKRKGCPVCAHAYRCERRKELGQVMEWMGEMVEDGKFRKEDFHLNTLTIKHYKWKTPEQEFQTLNQLMKKLIETSWFRNRYRQVDESGYVLCVEVTKSSDYWNFHIHFLGLSAIKETKTDHTKGLEHCWKKVGGGWSDDKAIKFRKNALEETEVVDFTGAIKEVVNYTLKASGATITDLAKIIAGTKRQRFFRLGGVFKSMAGLIKDLGNPLDWNNPVEDKVVPLPPSNINPETGEIAEVPDGTLDSVTMLYRAYVLRDWNYEWCFLMSRWWEQHGKGLITNKHKDNRLIELVARRERMKIMEERINASDWKWFDRHNGIIA